MDNNKTITEKLTTATVDQIKVMYRLSQQPDRTGFARSGEGSIVTKLLKDELISPVVKVSDRQLYRLAELNIEERKLLDQLAKLEVGRYE